MTKNRIGILVIGVLLVITIISTVIYKTKSPVSSENGTSSIIIPPPVAVKVFKLDSIGWGYEILVDNKSFIYQDQIPGVPGNAQFKTQANAMACGELVVLKIKRNQRPSISKSELDSLKIDY